MTAQQVATLAGVSVSAVSRTFTKDASVSPRMRERVSQAAQQLGYRPNHLARSLMTGRSGLVGLVSNHFGNPAFLPVFDRVTQAMQQHGLRPLLANLDHEHGAQAALDMMLQYRVEGVLIASSSPPAGFASSCLAAGLPVLHVFGRSGQRDGVPVVTVDNRSAAAEVATLMLRRGLRRLAYIGSAADDPSSLDRQQGFVQALQARRLSPLLVHAGDYSHEHGRQAMLSILDGKTSIDGVFCADDVLAIGALDACRERGIEVPAQLSVVGFDDMPLAAWAAYRLTTMGQPMAAMSEQAVRRLAAWLAGGAKPRSKLFDCALVERATLRQG